MPPEGPSTTIKNVFSPSVRKLTVSPPAPITLFVQLTGTGLLHVPSQTEIIVSKLLLAVLTVNERFEVPMEAAIFQMASGPPTPHAGLGKEFVKLIRFAELLNTALEKDPAELKTTVCALTQLLFTPGQLACVVGSRARALSVFVGVGEHSTIPAGKLLA